MAKMQQLIEKIKYHDRAINDIKLSFNCEIDKNNASKSYKKYNYWKHLTMCLKIMNCKK